MLLHNKHAVSLSNPAVSVYNNDLYSAGGGCFLARTEAESAAAQPRSARPGTPSLAAAETLQQRQHGASPGSPRIRQANRPSSSKVGLGGGDQAAMEAVLPALPPAGYSDTGRALSSAQLQQGLAARPSTAPVRLAGTLRAPDASLARWQGHAAPAARPQGSAGGLPATAGSPAATPRALQSFAGVVSSAGGAGSSLARPAGSMGRMGEQAAGWSGGPLGSAAARPSTPSFQPITREDRPGTAQPPAASTTGSANFLIRAGNWQADIQQAGQTVAGLYPKPPSTAPACASLHSGKPGAAPNPPADGLASFGISAAAFVAAAPKSAGQLLAGWAALTQAAMLAEAQLGSQENLRHDVELAGPVLQACSSHHIKLFSVASGTIWQAACPPPPNCLPAPPCRRFLLAPGPADQPLRCTIVRRVGGLLRGGTQYTLLLERDGSKPGSFLAAARKRKGGPGAASYILSVRRCPPSGQPGTSASAGCIPSSAKSQTAP